MQSVMFYVFATTAIAGAIGVISARNPVHSVLFLVLVFFNAAGLFLLLGAEFLAMMLIVVYVGAVIVLFLFVVMMLDINLVRLRDGFLPYLPLGVLVGVILLVELVAVVVESVFVPDIGTVQTMVVIRTDVTNTAALGQVLYTDYLYLFQIAGIVLLVAIVGAIVLASRLRVNVRKQIVVNQLARTKANSLNLRGVTTRGGI